MTSFSLDCRKSFPEGGWQVNQIDSFTCNQSLGYLTEIEYGKLRNALGAGHKEVSLIHVIYTGGTIGMRKDPITKTLIPESNYLLKTIKKMGSLNDSSFLTNMNIPNLFVLPCTDENKRVAFILHEYDNLLDSSNCTFDNWINVAKDIESVYQYYDGFVILHGTDTLAYAASTLSFILENLDKPVILTGSQIPISELRTDGRENFVNSIVMASDDNAIKEVCVFFNKTVMRGCRVVKSSSVDMEAFISPNHPCLAKLSIDVKVRKELLFNSNPQKLPLKVFSNLTNDVALLRIFPSISDKFIQDFFNSSVKGVVLQCYGAGNVPSLRVDMIDAFKDATKRGIVIVNITQCQYGGVKAIYATGAQLLECGVIPGFDMTAEAALTKLSYVLSKYPDFQTRRQMMCTTIRGEATIPPDFSLTKYGIDESLIYSQDQGNEMTELDRTIRQLNKHIKYDNVWSKKIFGSLFITALIEDDASVARYILDQQGYKCNEIIKSLDDKNWGILHYILFYNSEECLQLLLTMEESKNIFLADAVDAVTEIIITMEYSNIELVMKVIQGFRQHSSDLRGLEERLNDCIEEIESNFDNEDSSRKSDILNEVLLRLKK